MLSNCRVTTRFVIGQFARAIKGSSILRKLTCSRTFGNVLLDFVLQPLRCVTYVPTVTVARKFINNIALFNCSYKLTNHEPSCDVAIGQHLLCFSPVCFRSHLHQRFSNWEARLPREPRTILRGGANGNQKPSCWTIFRGLPAGLF